MRAVAAVENDLTLGQIDGGAVWSAFLRGDAGRTEVHALRRPDVEIPKRDRTQDRLAVFVDTPIRAACRTLIARVGRFARERRTALFVKRKRACEFEQTALEVVLKQPFDVIFEDCAEQQPDDRQDARDRKDGGQGQTRAQRLQPQGSRREATHHRVKLV